MAQFDQVTIRSLAGFESIYEALETCADSFFNKSVDKRKLAEKMAAFGNVTAAYIGDNLAGVACYYANAFETKTAFLSVIVIRKEFQGCGIGSQLLRSFLDHSKVKGMTVCRLEVDSRNENAISFYERKGFRKCGIASSTSYYYEINLNEREIRR